jgi:protein dithiol oxidoreductase (disulfide-forming)
MANKALLGIVGFLTLLLATMASAETLEFEEGTHYAELPITIRTRDPKVIEVTEYFSYGCPHCYQFDPQIGAWRAGLPQDVEFLRTPAVWNSEYQVYAQTYYAAEALNMLETVHVPIFQAIHGEGRRLGSPEAMADFFVQFGVDAADFAKTYASFGVRASVQQADARGRAYQSKGVPALIINGKYRIEGSMAGSNASMLRVADFLIQKERAAMAAGAGQ